MQKLPSCAGRAEFISSVPSLCHVTRALSIGVPSGGPGWLPQAVKVACHMPTIGSLVSAMFSSNPGCDESVPCHDWGRSIAPNLFELPHAALALVTSKQAETKVKVIA